jgi:hypothetical protein
MPVSHKPETEAANTAATSDATTPTVTDDASFFAVPDADEIAGLDEGTPLKQRNVTAKIAGLDTPVTMTQIQHSTTTATGDPTAAVTSVLHPPSMVPRSGDTVMYASFYDSMDPEDGPSRVLARGAQSGMLDFAEAGFVTPRYLPRATAWSCPISRANAGSSPQVRSTPTSSSTG